MDTDDSGEQSGPENESEGSTNCWINESSSSESELEGIPRKRRCMVSFDIHTKAVMTTKMSGKLFLCGSNSGAF